MAKSFDNLRSKMSPEARQASQLKTDQMLEEIFLNEIGILRENLKMTQQEFANNLDVSQPYVSKIEHKSDLMISKLNEVINALGGELVITAEFPDRKVIIKQPQDLEINEGV